ncbi:MAG: type II secretion system major pseudopilin GspG [Myxococcota bacterium]
MMLSRLSRSSLRAAAASRKGMSLVEIMVVIAIIGVLMTVIAVNVLGAMDGANQSATQIQIKKMEEALTFYAAKHKGKFPSTGDGLAAAKKYFPDGAIPTDAWGNEFLYFSPGTHGENQYEIISLGKDGKEGGADYDQDITSYSELAE